MFGSVGTTAFDNDWEGFSDFDHFLSALAGYSFTGRGSTASAEWQAALRRLPLSVIHETWTRYQQGAPVDCDNIPDESWDRNLWVTRTVNQGPPRISLSPSHPDWTQAPASTPDLFVQIAPPVFDRFGHYALVMNAAGMNAQIFENVDGRWIPIAEHWWVAY